MPAVKDSNGVNSSMMNAYQAAIPQTQSTLPFTIPLSPQAQAYALTGGILVLMVLVILKSNQSKEE